MTQMLPYALTGLIAVVFLLSLVLVARNFRKSLSDIFDRLMSMDNDLEDAKKTMDREIEELKRLSRVNLKM
jgi:hypothetical protein